MSIDTLGIEKVENKQTSSREVILDVKNLKIKFLTDEGAVHAVNGVDFKVESGSSVGILGESGCGKTITAYSVLQILPRVKKIVEGQINFKMKDGIMQDLLKLESEGEAMRKIRGKEISMIFQEPMTAFSPVYTICNQISEALMIHQDMDKIAARERSVKLLDLVGIPDPKRTVDAYPFQLSGGMRQRAMIAMALACNPRILIADEPTTALDVTIQAQVLKLIKSMQKEFNLSLMLITHNLGVIAHMVEHVYVMYLGRIVEEGPVTEIFDNPCHPYTKALFKSIPKLGGNKEKIYPIEGTVPDAYVLPSGCAFHPRCKEIAGEKCHIEIPGKTEVKPGHYVNCFRCSNAKLSE
ncbi:MAG: ABC transporter ATP-binding protein [Candidatus Ratteibacteria bacterium]|nr:ABC transporter ATP-binding protein [Candidatus Ratteibacteria bacterium]